MTYQRLLSTVHDASSWPVADMTTQIKEEMGNNEDFFKPYAVGGTADAAA